MLRLSYTTMTVFVLSGSTREFHLISVRSSINICTGAVATTCLLALIILQSLGFISILCDTMISLERMAHV